MEIDQEAQTTKRVLDRIPEDKFAWKPHPKSFSLGQLALHIASLPGSVTAAAVPDSAEAPNFSQPEPQEPPGSPGRFLQEPRECKGRTEEDGRRPAHLHVELDEEGKGPDVGTADRIHSLNPHES